MTLGLDVNKQSLDAKAAQAVLALRDALDKIESISAWLANTPVVENVDPLIAVFGYTDDEAYALRLFFGNIAALRTANQSTIDVGRKMTGLE